MFDIIHKHREREDGFTLIELLTVIVIIAILAAIAIPAFLNQKAAAADASVKSDVRNTAAAVETMRISEPNANYYAGTNADSGKELTLAVGNTTSIDPHHLSDGVQVRVSTHPENPNEYVVDAWHEGGKQLNGTTAVWRFDSLTGLSSAVSAASVDDGEGDDDGYDRNWLPAGWHDDYDAFAEWARANAPEGADIVEVDADGTVRFREYNPAYSDWNGIGEEPPMYFEHGGGVYGGNINSDIGLMRVNFTFQYGGDVFPADPEDPAGVYTGLKHPWKL